MPKKKSFFSKVLSFLFDATTFILKLLWQILASIISFVVSLIKTEVKRTQIESKKPVSSAQYSKFEVVKTLNGSFEDFENRLVKSKSTIGLIIGARGSGKSAIGMRILENIAAKNSKSVAAMGFLEETLPKWIKTVEKIEEVRNGSFILIDEGGILFSSRESMKDANKLLSELLLVARHKDLSVLFISQNSANLEVNAIRQADYLLLRKSSLLQKDFERKKIKEVYEEAEKEFSEFSMPDNRMTYVYSDEFRGYVKNELPGFWSEKTSKAFRGRT